MEPNNGTSIGVHPFVFYDGLGSNRQPCHKIFITTESFAPNYRIKWRVSMYNFWNHRRDNVCPKCSSAGDHVYVVIDILAITPEIEIYFKVKLPGDDGNGSIVRCTGTYRGQCGSPELILRDLRPKYDLNILQPLRQLKLECEGFILRSENRDDKKFWTLVEQNKFTDLTITAGDTSFKVHKLMLAANSPVFMAMFEHDLTESTNNCVTITDFSPDVVEDFLKFIYYEGFNTSGNLLDLLSCADKYDVEKLKLRCQQALESKITDSNAVQVLLRADLHRAISLKKKSIDFIAAHIHEVMKTSDWKLLTHELFSEIILSIVPTRD